MLEGKNILLDTVMRSFGDLYGAYSESYFDDEEIFLEKQYAQFLTPFWTLNVDPSQNNL